MVILLVFISARSSPPGRGTRRGQLRGEGGRASSAKRGAGPLRAALWTTLPNASAGTVRAAGIFAAGIRSAGIRTDGIRTAGIRAAGIRVAGIRAAGNRTAGIRAASIRKAGIGIQYPAGGKRRLAGPRPSRVISAGPGGRGLEADRFGSGVLDASLRLPWPPLLAGDAPAAAAAVRAAVASLLAQLSGGGGLGEAALHRELSAARGTPKLCVWNSWASGGRPVQTFSKVCMSLQSLRLENFLQTFCRLFLRIIYCNADFLQTFSEDHLL